MKNKSTVNMSSVLLGMLIVIGLTSTTSLHAERSLQIDTAIAQNTNTRSGEVVLQDYSRGLIWRRLMQYEEKNNQLVSRIVNKEFFMSARGARDPYQELLENLRIFKQVLPENTMHPQCTYPGRYEVLSRSFQLAPPVRCHELEQWFDEYRPQKLSYVYASQYISSPMSVFGHSFLLFSSNQIPEYLWATFNYAADIPENVSAIGYSFKGVTGGFWGLFDVIPLYRRIQIYNHFENRDLWFYDLNFSKNEVDLLAKIAWEYMHHARFKYYFLYENCAGILLTILEIVRPELNGLQEFSIYIPPGEVAKPLYEQGLVTEVRHKPALNRQLRSRLTGLDAESIAAFRQARATFDLNVPAQQNHQILEALLDDIDVTFAKSKGQLSKPQLDFKNQLLSARAKLGPQEHANLNAIKSYPPHTSHKTKKIYWGAKRSSQKNRFMLGIRPAIHGLLDTQDGYLRDSQISVLDISASSSSGDGVALEEVNFISLKNLQGVNIIERPLSWVVDLSVLKAPYLKNDSYYISRLNAGIGYSYEDLDNQLKYYLLAQTHLSTGHLEEQTPLAVGPILGQIYSNNKFRWHLNVFYYEPLYRTQNNQELGVNNELSYHLHANYQIYLSHRFKELHKKEMQDHSIDLSFSHYFN